MYPVLAPDAWLCLGWFKNNYIKLTSSGVSHLQHTWHDACASTSRNTMQGIRFALVWALTTTLWISIQDPIHQNINLSLLKSRTMSMDSCHFLSYHLAMCNATWMSSYVIPHHDTPGTGSCSILSFIALTTILYLFIFLGHYYYYLYYCDWLRLTGEM